MGKRRKNKRRKPSPDSPSTGTNNPVTVVEDKENLIPGEELEQHHGQNKTLGLDSGLGDACAAVHENSVSEEECKDKYAALVELSEKLLDDSEEWAERTAIITKIEHENYQRYARDILNDIVANIETPPSKKSVRSEATSGKPTLETDVSSLAAKNSSHSPQMLQVPSGTYRTHPSYASYPSQASGLSDSLNDEDDFHSAEQSLSSAFNDRSIEDVEDGQSRGHPLESVNVAEVGFASVINALSSLNLQPVADRQSGNINSPTKDRESNNVSLMDVDQIRIASSIQGDSRSSEGPDNASRTVSESPEAISLTKEGCRPEVDHHPTKDFGPHRGENQESIMESSTDQEVSDLVESMPVQPLKEAPFKDSTPEFEAEERRLLDEEHLQCLREEDSDVSTIELDSTEEKSRALDIKSEIVDLSVQKLDDDLLRNELLWQQQLLEKDKDIHAKEKQIQALDREINLLMMENKQYSERSGQIMEAVEQCERTISEMVSQKEQQRASEDIEKENIVNQTSQIKEDIANAERSFDDVYRKYERTKEIILQLKKNEDSLKASINDLTEKCHKADDKFEALKAHAEEKIQEANDRLEYLRKSGQGEITKLEALIKKAEMKCKSLENTIEQKTKENKELTVICDELITRVAK